MKPNLTDQDLEKNLQLLARDYFQCSISSMTRLKGDGSDRQIYRIHFEKSDSGSVIGVIHRNIQENQDFQVLTFALKESGIPVPEFYQMNKGHESYLMEDLGDEILADLLKEWEEKGKEQEILFAYKKVLLYLKQIQEKATIRLSQFLTTRKMDADLYRKDLEFFKVNFLNRFDLMDLTGDPLWEELNDKLISPLTCLEHKVFVYRDFQSRNIMWCKDQPWFLDYQSAMSGNAFYDLASLLYASKSYLTDKKREKLLEYWFNITEQRVKYEEFSDSFYLVVLLRRLRSLGSYGFLSVEKGKQQFYKSIRPTLEELAFLFVHKKSLSSFSHLSQLIDKVLKGW